MALLWIVHRSPRWREALLVMAGPVDAVAGDPVDAARFDLAPAPRAVLLGVAGDFEAELEFAHRFGPRLGPSLWVLLVRERDRAEVRRLFDALPAVLVALSSDAATLRRELIAALAQRPALPALGVRSRRDELARRFALWTEDLDPRDFLAATDPARAALPLLVRGEAGTGRGLVARYLQQATSRDARDRFVAWHDGIERDLRAGGRAGGGVLSICVEDVDRLALEVQRQIRDWVEHGPPHSDRVRWLATASDTDGGLDSGLAQALAGHELRLPPLRERPGAIGALVQATRRRFALEALDHLCAHPWPGNLRELDAVLRRTLAATSADPISPDDLRFEPGIFDADDLEAWSATTAPEQPVSIEEPASSPEQESPDPSPTSVHRLSSAIAHEVGNPLVGIRTYASLLATRFDDPEFRTQFRERVENDARRIESVIETLGELGGFPKPARERVDATALLAAILERSRDQIRERRLVVLEELDRERPFVTGDAGQIGFALELLLRSALAWIPPRGDLYVSTRHRPGSGGHVLRIELRLRGGGEGLGFESQALAVAVADAVARAHGGSLASEMLTGGTAAIQIDLPAPD